MTATIYLRCRGKKNNGARCKRHTKVNADNPPIEWYCWQHENQKYRHGFRLPNNLNYQLDGKLKHMAKLLLNKIPDLFDIRDTVGIDNIGFVTSYVNKNYSNKKKYADCKRVSSSFKAFIPYKYIITFYDYNTALLSDNQKKLLMYHELKHIDPEGGLKRHDVEDFEKILREYGFDYLEEGVKVPDILK